MGLASLCQVSLHPPSLHLNLLFQMLSISACLETLILSGSISQFLVSQIEEQTACVLSPSSLPRLPPTAAGSVPWGNRQARERSKQAKESKGVEHGGRSRNCNLWTVLEGQR